jgi:hypothetical protein
MPGHQLPAKRNEPLLTSSTLVSESEHACIRPRDSANEELAFIFMSFVSYYYCKGEKWFGRQASTGK